MKVLLSGQPRVGKSKLVRRLAEEYPGNAGGVLAAEILGDNGRRCGFELHAVWSGPGVPLTVVERAVLARDDRWSPLRVGRYYVDAGAVEIAVRALDAAMHEGGLVLIDEIGPLQIAVPAFRDAVLRCLDSRGQLLGTIARAEDPFLEAVRHRPGVRLLDVTRQNSHHLADGLRNWLCKA